METIVADIAQRLPPLFNTTSAVYTIVASGTGAMEAAVANTFSRGETVLVVSNGYFGERFASIARAYGLQVVEVASEWGTSVDASAVAQAYAEHPNIAGVLVVHSETSTGALNDLQAIGALFADTEVVVVVDAISGLISHELDMDGWSLDIVLAASHKGFMLPPGLAFVAISDKAWAKVDTVEATAYYWSFARLRHFHPMPPSSPAVSLVFALHESLTMLEQEGLSAIQARQREIGDATLAALTAIGFRPFVTPPHQRNYVVTAVLAPDGVNASSLVTRLESEFGITMTGGQGEFAGSLMRVGHVGSVDRLDVVSIVAGIELSLAGLGHEVELGRATATLLAQFAAGASA